MPQKGIINALIESATESLFKLPYGFKESLKEIPEHTKKYGLLGFAWDIVTFPFRVPEKAIAKSVEENLKEAGVSPKSAKETGEMAGILSSFLAPYGVLGALKKAEEISKAIKYGKEYKKAEELAKTLRRKIFGRIKKKCSY